MRRLAVFFLLVGAAGCASAGHDTLAVETMVPLTEAELADYQEFTALGVIRTLRPDWVATGTDRIKVFCFPNRQGGVGELKKYRVSEIKEIKYHPERHTTGNRSTYAYITVTLKGNPGQ